MARPNTFSRSTGSTSRARVSSSSGESSPESSRRPKHSLHYILDEPETAPARSARVHRDASERASPPVARGFPYAMTLAPPPSFARVSSEDARLAYGSRSSPIPHGSSASPGGYDDSPSLGRAWSLDWVERETSSHSSISSLSLATPRREELSDDDDDHAPSPAQSHSTNRVRAQEGKSQSNSVKDKQRRLARQCTIDGCDNYTIDRGLCFRHGGGKVCMIEGCTSSAKARGVCWRHVEGCKRGAKSRGLCWSHGGGTKCSVEGCDKTTISKGLCWTHGGGKRCLFDGCKRPASEKRHNFCPKHMAQVSQKDFVFEV